MKNVIAFLGVGEDSGKTQLQSMFLIPAARRSNMASGNLLSLFIYYHHYSTTLVGFNDPTFRNGV